MSKDSETPKKNSTGRSGSTVPPKRTAERKKTETDQGAVARTTGSKKTTGTSPARKPPQKKTPMQRKSTPQKSTPQKNAPPDEQGGLSFMTVLLILLSIAVVVFLVWFCIDRFMPKQPEGTESLPPTESVSDQISPSPSLPPITQGSPTPSESNPPDISPTPSVSPTPPPTTTPTPSIPPNTPDTERVLPKGESTPEKVTVEVEGGEAYICYTTPYLSVPYNTEIEKAVNSTIDSVMLSVRNKLEKNIKRNYDPFIHGAYEVTVNAEFFRSKNSFSIVLYYETIAGKGDFIEETTTATFNAENGQKLELENIVKDKEALITHLELLLPHEEDRNPGFFRGDLSSGFYFEGTELILLYNGATVYTTSPLITELRVTDQNLFTGN